MTKTQALEKLLFYCGPETPKSLKKITGWNISTVHRTIELCLAKNAIHRMQGMYYFGKFPAISKTKETLI